MTHTSLLPYLLTNEITAQEHQSSLDDITPLPSVLPSLMDGGLVNWPTNPINQHNDKWRDT